MDETMWMAIAAIFAILMTLLSPIEGNAAIVVMTVGAIAARLGIHLVGNAIARKLTGDRK
jgi:hypothetical protein